MKKINITFGKPLEFTEFYDKKLDSEELRALAEKVLDNILIHDTEVYEK